jgi:transcriptional regulator with XRE-family HTH domain
MPERQGWPAMATRFAGDLRRLRETVGISQEELAFRADIHRTQVSFIESGHRSPRLDTLVKLAGALGVGVEALLDGISWEPSVWRHGGFGAAPRTEEADAEVDAIEIQGHPGTQREK